MENKNRGFVTNIQLYEEIKRLQKMINDSRTIEMISSIETMSLSEVSRTSKISEVKIRRAIERGDLLGIPDGLTPIKQHKNNPTKKVGGRPKYKVPIKDFREWMERLGQESQIVQFQEDSLPDPEEMISGQELFDNLKKDLAKKRLKTG